MGFARVAGTMRLRVAASVAMITVLHAAVTAQERAPRASASVLSEHHLEALPSMEPQQQAEFLLERAINRYQGATDELVARAPGWLGRIKSTSRLESLFRLAINSDDMRVRVAAIEVNVSSRGLARSEETIDRLEPIAREGAQGPRANALWDIGLLGNRGIRPDRAFAIISASLRDPNVNIRYWAVEGLAFLGSDQVIEPLLDVFHDDPSPMIRERAACSLAQSGMLNEVQRWRAVPRLLEFTTDGALDAETRGWVFQALRDITGQTLPPDAWAWKRWYYERRK
ncbi:MAG TPA: HEAT repeat domain-containing protein [Vicinamibacterales bacterium]|nr:HEAT repeat domain-containing protein [Vicinamibacterales bacterium]